MSCRLVKRYMGGSTSFNGTSSVITTNTNQPQYTNEITVIHRLKLTALQGANAYSLRMDGDAFGFYMGGSKSASFIIKNVGGAYLSTVSRPLNLFNWYSLAGTAKVGEKLELFVDGEKLTESATNLADTIYYDSSRRLCIGAEAPASNYFTGKICEVLIYNVKLTAEQIKQVHRFGNCGVESIQSYDLDDLPSSYEDSAGGYTGTGTATTYSPDVPTQLPVAIDTEARSSLSFDGATSGVDGVQLVNADIDSYTLYAQAMVKTAGNHCIVYRMLGDGSNRSPRILINSSWVGTFSIRLNDNGTNTNYNIAVSNVRLFGITPNKWFTVILRVKNGEQTLFINGIKAGSGVGVGIPTWNTLAYKIGYDDNVNYRLNGFVKRVCFWTNKYFSDEEIKNLHFKNVVPYKDDPTKLVLNLKLNEGAGTIAYDSSGNGNNATISGATWSTNTPTKPRTLVTTPRTIAVNRTNITC